MRLIAATMSVLHALMLVSKSFGSQAPAQVPMVVRNVPLCRASAVRPCPAELEQSAGLLRFSGGIHLLSQSADFGGISALRVAAMPSDDTALPFVAVSDRAMMLTGRLLHNSSGWLVGVERVQMGHLLGTDGAALSGIDRATGHDLKDSESLASSSDTDPLARDLLVAFERLHRVLRYPVGAQGAVVDYYPVGVVPTEQLGLGAHNGRISRCEENGGVEAMDYLSTGALWVVCEEPISEGAPDDFSPGWLLPSPDSSSTAFRVDLLLQSRERSVSSFICAKKR